MSLEIIKPTWCPFCGGGFLIELDGWPAFSELDPNNKATLTEWQCKDEDCGVAFWV